MRTTIIAATLAIMSFGTFVVQDAGAANLLTVAKPYIAMHERKNQRSLSKMLGVNPRVTPWCGAFVSYVARKAGRAVPAGSNIAKSWMRFGHAARTPQKGDVIVVRNRRGYHVTIVYQVLPGKVVGLGGNQQDAVALTTYDRRRIVAIRR